SLVSEVLASAGSAAHVHRRGIPDRWAENGSIRYLRGTLGLSAEQLALDVAKVANAASARGAGMMSTPKSAAPNTGAVARLKTAANRIRKTVLDMCIQRGGFAGQGVALAEIGVCLFHHEMRRGGESNWPGYDYHDRFVLSNGHDAVVVYAALE